MEGNLVSVHSSTYSVCRHRKLRLASSHLPLSRLGRVISSRLQLGVENGYGIVKEFSRYTPWAVSNRSISDDRSLIGLIVSNPQYHRCFV